jgi:hypothetical protein
MPISTSTREAIAEHVKELVEALPDFQKVVRRVPAYEELRAFAITEFPVVGIQAGLPVPAEKASARVQAQKDLITSDLEVAVYCYLMDSDDDTADTAVSTYLNTLWRTLYADRTFGNRVLDMRLAPAAEVSRWAPFVAFKLSCLVRYLHTIGEV